MSTLQASLAAAFQAHLGSPEAPFAIGGKPYPIAIDVLSDVQIVTLFRYGCKRAPNDKYNSENKKARDEGKASLDPQTYFTSWLAQLGTKQPGTRQRASSTDYRSKGWLAYFRGVGLKLNGKTVSSATLEQALEEYVRRAILASAADEAEAHTFMDAMDELIEEYQDQILEEAELNVQKGYPGFFIEEARAKAQQDTIQPTTAVKIAIKPKG